MGDIAKAKRIINIAKRTGKLLNLSNLELTGDDIATLLPTIKESMPNLEKLDLGNNRIAELPPEIGGLTNLKELRLAKNELTKVPPEIGNLKALENLFLKGNRLATVPPEIGNLTNLRLLGLSANKLTTLPTEIGNLKKLETFGVADNELTTLLPEIKELEKLTTLYANNNKLTTLPPEIGSLKALEKLYLGKNQLATVPPEIGNLTNLKVFFVGENQFSHIPKEVIAFEQLECLDFRGNKLKELLPDLVNLKDLKGLYLGDNLLESIPEVVLQLTGLEELDLSKNKLKSVSKDLARLQELLILKLNENELRELPPEMVGLVNLQKLELGGNKFVVVPNVVLELKGLENLSMQKNGMTDVPKAIKDLAKISVLDVTGNPLTAKAMIRLDDTFGTKAKFNRAPFRSNPKLLKTLDVIYPKKGVFSRGKAAGKAAKIDALIVPGPFTDEEGKIVNAQQVVYSLLRGIPLEGPTKNELYFESYRDLVEPVMENKTLQEKKNDLGKIATSLGNCETPVLNLLMQTYVGKYIYKDKEARPSNFDAIVAREAFEKAIVSKLSNAVDEDGEKIMPNNEKVEQVQALVNAFFSKDASTNEHNKLKVAFPEGGPDKLPNKTLNDEYGYKIVKPALVREAAKILCQTDANGTLETNDDGAYVFDPKKLERIVNKYKNGLGIVNPRDNRVANYESKIQEVMMKEENQILFVEIDEEGVHELLDFNAQKEELEDILYGVADQEVDAEYEKYFAEQTAKIEKLANRLNGKPEEAAEKDQTYNLSSFTSALNEGQRSQETSQTAQVSSSPRQNRTNSQGRGI